MRMHSNLKKWSAEFIGTLWLTLGGCGSAVLAAAFPEVGIGLAGVALAFGLTVVTGAALGPISGRAFNPAVSVGLAVGGRFSWGNCRAMVAQVLGAIVGGGILFVIATGKAGAAIGGFATGYGAHSPGGYGLGAAMVTEVVMTAIFLIVILGATAKRAARLPAWPSACA
jgi:aquaporin Z